MNPAAQWRVILYIVKSKFQKEAHKRMIRMEREEVVYVLSLLSINENRDESKQRTWTPKVAFHPFLYSIRQQ